MESNRISQPLKVGLALTLAFFVGFGMRQWAYSHTESMRNEPTQENAFYWGDRIVRGANPNPGPASWSAIWRSYVAVYADNELHPAPLATNTLDYVPLRLLVSGVWVNYLNIAYGPVSQWRPEFSRSFAAFSMMMELAAAVAMFFLVACWVKRSSPIDAISLTPRTWGRWELAAAAATLIWCNPASIIDSHVYPHGQTWILPFYLFSVLAMIEQRYFLAGVIFGLGAMFKGQILLVMPALVLWPLFDRQWRAAIWLEVGVLVGIFAVVWPWLIHGSMAWAKASFFADTNDSLRKGRTLNFAAVLARGFHMTLHEHIVNLHLLSMHITLELKTALILIYAVLLILCSWGIARQARAGDRRLLLSIAAPWAVMFYVLGQMDARYLVWAACFSAGAIAVGRLGLATHVILTWAAVAVDCESLLNHKPDVHPTFMHILTKIEPLTLLLMSIAVAILFLISTNLLKAKKQPTAAPPALA